MHRVFFFARRPRALYGKHRPNQRRKSTVPVSIPTDRHEYKVNRKRDQTNEYLDEICGDEALKNVVRSFDYILENRRPIRAFGNVSQAKKGHLNNEVIDGPLATDGQTVDIIIKFVKWTR